MLSSAAINGKIEKQQPSFVQVNVSAGGELPTSPVVGTLVKIRAD